MDSERDKVEREREASAAGKLKADQAAAIAVSVLPDGVQARWEAYADYRFDALLRRQGATLRVGGSLPTFVSLNTPYQIGCGPYSVDVTFGSGDEATGVEIIPGNDFMPQGDGMRPRPELPVAKDSVAAEKLFASLCEKIAARMDRLVGRP